VAESPHADAGRNPRRSGDGNPAGFSDLAVACQLFMHYAFDRWMDREHPDCPFERYADDVVVHCDTEDQAR